MPFFGKKCSLNVGRFSAAPAGAFPQKEHGPDGHTSDLKNQRRAGIGQKKKTGPCFFASKKTIVNKSNAGKLDIATETTENVSCVLTMRKS